MLKLEPEKKKSSLAFGDAIDSGLNALLLTKDLDHAISVFTNTWNNYKGYPISYTKSDLDEFLVEEDPTNTWLSLLHRGCIMLQEYNEQIIPLIKEVLKVQIDQSIPNDQGDELVIKTDFIAVWNDDRRILFDNKTSSIKYTEDSVKSSSQLAIYYEMLKDEYALDAAGYIVIPKRINKKKLPRCDIKIIIDNIPQEFTNETMQSYDDVLDNIKQANFQCNKKSCINKYGKCDFYNVCKARINEA